MTVQEQASIIIPDLHGSPQFLEWVLRQYPERHFIFLGDLINRGPDSRRVLRTALDLAAERRATLLWGNHEDRAWSGTAGKKLPQQVLYLQKHNAELLRSYGGDAQAVMKDLTRFVLVARPYAVEGQALYAHASRPRFGLNERDLHGKGHLTDRPQRDLQPLPVQFFPGLMYSVHGHTVQKKPLIDLKEKGVVYLDLGSSKTGHFAIWDAETQEAHEYRS